MVAVLVGVGEVVADRADVGRDWDVVAVGVAAVADLGDVDGAGKWDREVGGGVGAADVDQRGDVDAGGAERLRLDGDVAAVTFGWLQLL